MAKRMFEGRPLLDGPSRSSSSSAARAAIFSTVGCMALCALALLGNRTSPTMLNQTSVTSNCDGSTDITTTSIVPVNCAPTFTSDVLPTVYSSMPPPVTYAAPGPMYPAPGPALAVPPMMVPPAGVVGGMGNVYQYPTIWSGDHAISGGQVQWAAEDAAQHALNLANWRIKLLEARKEQARLSKEVMITGSIAPTHKDEMAKANKETKEPHTQKQMAAIEKSVLNLASETRKAISALAKKVEKSPAAPTKGANPTKKLTNLDKNLKGILRQMDNIAEDYSDN